MTNSTKNILPFDYIQELIQNYIKKAVGTELERSKYKDLQTDLSLPVHIQHGNFTTNIALRLAKIYPPRLSDTPQEGNLTPIEIANNIVKYLNENKNNIIEKTEVAGPGLINIFLTPESNTILIENILSKQENNFKLNIDTNLHWVIEHTSPNPNKAMHLGHLRNNLVGMSLANLIEVCGGQVTRDCVDNNRGIAIAKAMYGFLALMRKNHPTLSGTPPYSGGDETHPRLNKEGAGGGEYSEEQHPTPTLPLAGGGSSIKDWINNKDAWYTPTEKNMRPDVFVTDCYTGGEDLRKNDATGEIDKTIREMVLDWENKDADTWALWQHILDYSYAGMQMTLTRLGNKWDKIWHEHEHYQAGKEYIELGLKKGIFKRLDDGAVLTQIEEKYNIPETILLKNDGTALYITQDIALTDLKKKEYKADKLVWVIGPEQSLAMQQMFAVCEQLGIGKLSDFIHIPYGYMGLKDEDGNFKKMSSRAGTVLLIDDLIDTVKENINKLIGERLQIVENSDLLEKVALAVIKFSILKVEKNMNMAFDIDESINLTGDSGVYLLYTVARIKSILREGESRGIDISSAKITGEIASNVIRKIHGYKIILNNSRAHLSVHPIAHYLLELASLFNSWYASEKILDDGDTMPEKLAILNVVMSTIEHGLNILGIQTVEKM